MSGVTIRPEAPQDIVAIRQINIAAFRDHPHSQQTEHLIVEALRAADALELSLVAVSEDRAVGHIAFSRAAIGAEASGWFLLGPVAVLPPCQRQGVGSALVTAGLEELRRRGAEGCVLVGDPGYYGRFGFRTVPGVTYEGVPEQYVLCRLLQQRAAPRGPIRAHQAFLMEAADTSWAIGSRP